MAAMVSVRLRHPESGRIRVTGEASASRYLDAGWEFADVAVQEAEEPKAIDNTEADVDTEGID